MRYVTGLLVLSTFGIYCAEVCADYKDDIDYTRLLAGQGASVPNGAGVPVTLAEAEVAVDHDNDPLTPEEPAWLPDPGDSEFSGKLISDITGATPGVFSTHARGVARLFFGNNASIASGITMVDAWLADHWLDTGMLNGGIGEPVPFLSSSRVANHSWIGSSDDLLLDGNLLRRIDWLVDRDEFIQCVGLSNGSANQALAGSAFNVIAVGRTDGGHGQGSVAIDNIYRDGRTRPDIVAPQSSASTATPVIASASSLLVQLGAEDPGLSTDPVVLAKVNRNGDNIYNAERSEVVKAALMAGADRATVNEGDVDITDYRGSVEHLSDNGLDRRYGAGQLNIYNSFHIIAGGEQNGAEDAPSEGGLVHVAGFDYDPLFGGANGSNPVASYYFSTPSEVRALFASLVWNIHIDAEDSGSFTGLASLYDLNLFLYQLTGGQTLIASSESKYENSENLWLRLEPNQVYMLQVKKGDSQQDFEWDYALAWRMEPDADGDGVRDGKDNCTEVINPGQRDTDQDGFGNYCDADFDNSGTVNFTDLGYMKSVFFSGDAEADLNADGVVNFTDLGIMKAMFFGPPGPGGLVN